MSIINTNINALNTQRYLSASQASLSTTIQRLSSGLRVNSAKDDAAGLAIAERMSSQIKGMNVAMRNANDAISLAQTGEGALGKVSDALQRMRELAVQSANATNSVNDRANLQTEYSALSEEVTRVLEGTRFNGVQLLNTAASLTFQVGAENVGTDQITVMTSKFDQIDADAIDEEGEVGDDDYVAGSDATTATGVTNAVNGSISTSDGALEAIDFLDAAIGEITTGRATFGAAQNRFDSVISNLMVAVENQAASRSRIMDTNFAAETANLSRSQILQQAGTAMLAQANSMPNSVMALLRG